ncbi:hypothetical protein [Klenkia terrae]|uniref:Uncharacterized protein n=1 Tax=Klenkia terrae TaxID=1052259 RepID=A0ABU8E648_9ACTN|nr:hypothetical protein [Klenkia terrae]SSC24123.1 Hypothetical protein KLENKIAIHU_2730 [Klenkia terrae]
MSESTDVDADVVLEFASRLHARAADVATATSSLQLPIAGAGLGGSGMQESVVAAGAYSAATQATARFLRDVHDGLLSLSYVAATAAAHYRAGDAEQAVSMAAVDAAFAPATGQTSITSRRADAAAQAERVAHEALRAQNQVDGTRPPLPPDPEQQRFGNQLDAGRRPGTADDRYSRPADAVAAHDDQIGDDGVLAEARYDPAGDHDEALRTAERLTAQHGIPYTAVVDDHGVSEVVQADPDDVPAAEPDTDVVQEHDQQATDLAAALGGAG